MNKVYNRTEKAPAPALDELWYGRYRTGHPPAETPELNAILTTMLSHQTRRDYLPIALPEGALELAIAAAQSAPSSSNMQAWDVVAIQDQELKARINALSSNQRHIQQAPILLVWVANLSRLRHIAAQLDRPGMALDYFESFVMGTVDAALAAQNAVVALESIGLSTCYIGALRNHPQEIAKELNLPPESFAVFGMTVGVPDPDIPASIKPRLPQRMVFHREHYKEPLGEDFEAYDRRFADFQSEQALNPVGWSVSTVDKIKGVEIMRNRDRLMQEVLRRGFKLA